jgi:hypothetical protein
MPSTIILPAEKRSKLVYGTAALVLCLLIAISVLASNGWLPHTDAFSGKRTGWFGSKSSPPYEGGVDAFRGRGGSLDPASLPNAPLAGATPQLAREYLYAGSRLLAVEDANANAAPPADLAIWRPSSGEWWVMSGQGSQQVTQQWGVPCNPPTLPADCDRPAPGDYDGDGKTDFSIFRPSTGVWWIINSSNGSSSSVQFGVGTDKLAQADFDGDGKTDMAVFRLNDPSPNNASWYIRKSSDGTWGGFQFGLSTDIPAPADYDGDGRADIGVYRSSASTFYLQSSAQNSATQTINFGQSGDVPVSADYDGDGKADAAVWRPGVYQWLILNSSNQTTDAFTFGDPNSDVNVQNDYDGDGKVDRAFWRPSEGKWYIAQSTKKGQPDEMRYVQWGAQGDIPVPAFYRR